MWRKVSDVEIKYFATSDYNKFTHDTIDAKIKGKGFLDKCTIAAFRNSADMNKKVATLATKAEEDKIIKCLIQAIFAVKVVLKMMVRRII